MSRVVAVADHAFGSLDAEQAVAERFGAEFRSLSCVTEEETIASLAGADVVFVNFAPISRAVLQVLAPGATVIRYGVGYDNVDVQAAREEGIAVANVPDYGIETVAEHTAASILSLLRRLPHYDHTVRENGWCRPGDVPPVRSFSSITVGLIGTGRIAMALHERLKAFGFGFVAYDPYMSSHELLALGIRPVDLEMLAADADVISLHAPLTPDTRHILDASFLSRVRRGAVVVNTSRGGLVDIDALIEAIAAGTIVGAALDVTEPEPLPDDSRLRSLPGVILTPHAAFFSLESVAALQRLASEEAGRALAGQPLRCPVS